MIFTDQHGTSLKPLREYTAWAVSPLVWAAALPHGAVKVGAGVKTRDTLERENLQLHEQQLLLQAKLQKLEALEAENRRIRELLASSKNLQDHVLIAEIIAVSQDPYRHQITLNKGSSDKVYRGQALIDATGVMGQVVEVGPGTSQALLITDPDHGIPVEINRTGLQTIALGLGDGQGLKLPFLPSNADVKVGDLLVSSALGGRFPAGYPVGQIYNVKNMAGEHFMEAVAYPSAKLNQGRQALLVWSEHKDMAVLPAPAPEPTTSTAPVAIVPAQTASPAALDPTPAMTAKPAAASPSVAAPAVAPSATAPKPVVAVPAQTAAPAGKPAAVAPKPAAVAPKPAAVAPKPAAVAAKPAATPKPVPAPVATPKPAAPPAVPAVPAAKPATKPAAATATPAKPAATKPAPAPATPNTTDQAKPQATPEPAPVSQ
jgi:rod shape-determining protein MreC